MYLTQLFIENAGPIDKVEIDLPFNEDGTPKPIIFVGENGSGKTVLLSGIVDSFYEMGNALFEDVLPKTGTGHKLYKIQGGINIKFGKEYSLFGLKYKFEDGKNQFYLDSSGNFQDQTLRSFIPDFPPINKQQNAKILPSIPDDQKESFQEVFMRNAIFFLPAHRHETPFWKNKSLEDDEALREAMLYKNHYGKDIEIIKSLEDNKNYLMDLVLDFSINQQFPVDQVKWANINEIIKKIKGRDDIRFGIGRRGGHRVSIVTVNENSQAMEQLVPTIDALSLGETLLLNLFLNIIRYSDKSQKNLADISGIVLIDEIDTHLHTKLLRYVLPELLSMFPKIQFIVTTHSPIFLIGMQDIFGEDGFEIRDMPTGDRITIDRFSEFQHAFEAFNTIHKIDNGLKEELLMSDKKIVLFVEGPTDVQYLKKAIEYHELTQIFATVDIKPIGEVTPEGTINSNNNVMHSAKKFLEVNTNLIHGKYILLFDPEEKVTEKDVNNKLFILKMPYFEANQLKKGIENLFHDDFITRVRAEKVECFKTVTTQDGENLYTKVEVKSDKKQHLCTWICDNASNDDFSTFGDILNRLSIIIQSEAVCV